MDLASHAKQADLADNPIAGFEGAQLSPDGTLAVVYGPKATLFVNAASGTAVGTTVSGQGIADVAIDRAR